MELAFDVSSSLVRLATDWEDGTDILGVSYYVTATARGGRRWVHERAFASRLYDVVTDEDGETFQVVRDAPGQAQAEALLARIEAAGAVDLVAHWEEVDPAYGSEAYAELDATGYFRDVERMADLDFGR